MRVTIIILLMSQIAGYTQNYKVNTGTYKGVIPSKFEQVWSHYFQGIDGYDVGLELIINDNSTFQYSTCTISTGKWHIFNDSLFLLIDNVRWRNESLEKNGYNGTWPKIPSRPIGFKIKNNYLEHI